MVRTYAGDRWRFAQVLLPTVRMLVNRLQLDVHLVLDQESPADHQWASCLSQQDTGMTIQYQAQPEDWEELFHGTAFGTNNKKYAKAGYDRQQWSTFYLDQQAAPHHQIIGTIDADGCFLTYLTRESLLAPDGRIRLRAAHAKSHYRMDTVALGLPTPYDFMYIDRMPISFWKDTFAKVRAHIAAHWNTTFDQAFAQFSAGPYSQFNILATYALAMEPDRYVLVLHDDASHGAISVGSNYCNNNHVTLGCCATYQGSNCTMDAAAIATAITGFNRHYPTAWIGNRSMSDQHYAHVHRDIKQLQQQDPQRYETMAHLCDMQMRGQTNRTLCIEY